MATPTPRGHRSGSPPTPRLRAAIRTGDLRADQLFGGLIARRADRLLDELLRSGGSAAVTSSSAGSGTASSSAAVPVTGTAA